MVSDGLDNVNLRGQSYENGANIVEKYKGLQARILMFKDNAKFIPCNANI